MEGFGRSGEWRSVLGAALRPYRYHTLGAGAREEDEAGRGGARADVAIYVS